MKKAWICSLLVAAAAAAAGCGGSSTHATTHHPATTAATAPPTTTTTTTPTTDCNAAGINPTGMREGTCTHGGITWTIVDVDHTLKLKTVWARLLRVQMTKSLTSTTATTTTANGRFVIATVKLTNNLPAPQAFDAASSQQAGLILDGALFKEAVGAESQADANSCMRVASSIQPGQSDTCDVVFDVPAHAAADLGKHGSGDLYLVNFGADLAASVLPQAIGQIRLYH